ncbi:MAG TPA: DedA family protein [Nocardioidaceae bacterium]|nr:DedA family protein [Nocardioidaceae bacterium]
MHSVIAAIQSLPPLAAYAIIAALVFGEAAVFIGFVLPGETSVVLGGFLASVHDLNLTALCALVVACAIVGDSVGYEVGRLFGPRLVDTSIFRKHEAKLDSARGMLRDRGGPAVFVGRFTAFFRAVMPGLAGLSGMRYRRFLFWNALGGFLWGVGYCLAGYFAGQSYERVARDLGRGTAIVVAAVIVAGLIGWHFYRRRTR